ncbi:MAG: multidrug resistance transporter [Haloplasmataceae bacterium]|nr:multidrug resistance transporter [Haloplasmataceae bacterium]
MIYIEKSIYHKWEVITLNSHNHNKPIRPEELLSLEKSIKTIKRLIIYLGKQKLRIFSVILIMVIITGISMITPILIKNAIDIHIANGNVEALIKTAIILISIYFINSLLSMVNSFVMIKVSQETLRTIRKDCFTKMQKLNVSFFDKNKVGDLMSRLSNDVDTISNSLTHTIIGVFTAVITLIASGAVMFWINPILACITIVTVPILVISIRKLTVISRSQFRKSRVQLAVINSFIQENVNGVKIIQSFNQEKNVINEYIVENEKYTKILIKSSIYGGLIRPIIGFLNTLRYVIIVSLGAFLAYYGKATAGTIISFTDLADKFSQPINHLAQLYTDIQQALVSAERVFEIIDSDDIIEDAIDAIEVDHLDGLVEFKNVDFSYIADKPVLKDINFTIMPGMKVALVGPTGAGKTSIINLLNRFYEVQNGDILIDDLSIKAYKKDSIRNKIGIVLQDTYLFTDTVKNNLKYGNKTLGDEVITEACQMTNCHNFIMNLPNQYDTILNRDGSNLSHGQRQLISITRTLLSSPDILVLDEATSSVDTITEKQIQEAMKLLTQGKTTFMIAHRLSTIRNCDLILVINHGKIIEQGNHHELLAAKGLYYELNNSTNSQKLKEFEIIG